MDNEASPLILTSRDHPDEWSRLSTAARAISDMGFSANLHLVEEARYAGESEEALRQSFSNASVIFAADKTALCQNRYPILCIDPLGETASFRALAKDVWIVENNCATGNLLFDEFEEQLNEHRLLTPEF
ncbi:MAG: hypothetical protein KTR21_01270 [Rhodobacteraceae bacterium]|nr:hypothetical protein [Paracoccaceae bacterium]